MELRKLDFVLAQLRSYSGPKKELGEASTFVSCPYHSERTPSFRIFHSSTTKSPGFGKCYGCGRSEPWDVVAPLLGLKSYEYAKPSVQYARPVREEVVISEQKDHNVLKFSAIPPGKLWRSISTDLLIAIGCKRVRVFYTESEQYGKTMLYFPVLIKGELRGYIRARLRKEDGKASYLNSKGGWSADYGLFPYDYSVKIAKGVLVLVEGPRDALRLLSLGIPAIAILGTQSWSKRKSRMLELSGATTIITCFDGDDAGIAARALVQPLLKHMFRVINFDLSGDDSPYARFAHKDHPTKAAKKKGVDLWDPGNMPNTKVRELKKLVRRYEKEAA